MPPLSRSSQENAFNPCTRRHRSAALPIALAEKAVGLCRRIMTSKTTAAPSEIVHIFFLPMLRVTFPRSLPRFVGSAYRHEDGLSLHIYGINEFRRGIPPNRKNHGP